MSIRVLTGDCRVTLPTLDAGSVQAVVTSPPYYGLRDYGLSPLVWGGDAEHAHEWSNAGTLSNPGRHGQMSSAVLEMAGQVVSPYQEAIQRTHPSAGSFCPCGAWLGSLGLEPTPDLYVEHLVEVFRHVRRVLRDDGVLWLNLGDSYNNRSVARQSSHQTGLGFASDDLAKSWREQTADGRTRMSLTSGGLKEKDLMMMPFRVAMALQQDGWYLRSVIPWLKRNSMPESVTDRPATAVEYVFLLSKSARYFWDADAVRAPHAPGSVEHQRFYKPLENGQKLTAVPDGRDRIAYSRAGNHANGRNRRNSDWFFESWQGLLLDEQDDPLALVVNPAPFTGSHFATFPPKLVEPMIKASTSEKGQCPECGAPWVRVTQRTVSRSAQGTWNGASAQASKGLSRPGQFIDGESTTTGWRPSCAHTAEPVPQTVLDCFGGAGTVGLVADRLQRNAILCELKPEYADMGVDRLLADGPMFAEVDVA